MLSIRKKYRPESLNPDFITETFRDQTQQFSSIFPKK